MAIVGVMLLAVGVKDARQSNKVKVFDKAEGLFRKDKLRIALDDIASLQVLTKRARRLYYSNELNLVMRDRTRLHVIETGGSENVIAEYAKTPAEFLDKPLSFPGREATRQQ